MRINIGTFVFILSFIYLCSCQIELFMLYAIDYPTATYQCLASKGNKKVTKTTWIYPGYLDTFFNDWIKAKNVGMDMDLIFYPCRIQNPSDNIAKMMRHMPNGFDGTIWIHPNITNDDSLGECSWKADYGHEQNCAALSTYLTLLNKRGIKVGIAVWSKDWIQAFGDSCKQLGTLKLIWLTMEETQNYDTFVPFGGWKKPSYKYITTQNIQCGIYLGNLYYQPWMY